MKLISLATMLLLAGANQLSELSQKEAGCCQRSKTDTRCAHWDYLGGKCIKLFKKNIGCNRALWVPRASFNEKTQRCEKYVEIEKEAGCC